MSCFLKCSLSSHGKGYRKHDNVSEFYLRDIQIASAGNLQFVRVTFTNFNEKGTEVYLLRNVVEGEIWAMQRLTLLTNTWTLGVN